MKLLKGALLAISTSVMLLPALNVKAQNAPQCTQALLAGSYAGNTTTTLPSPGAAASQFVFDASTGAVTVLELVNNNGTFAVNHGTGTVPNFFPQYCVADVTINFGSGDLRTYYFFIDEQGKELRYVQREKGVVSSGTATRQ